jgi:hypothetical protein
VYNVSDCRLKYIDVSDNGDVDGRGIARHLCPLPSIERIVVSESTRHISATEATFRRKMRPGTDVMVTIFGDFRQFSAKKWRFSQKPCYDPFFA